MNYYADLADNFAGDIAVCDVNHVLLVGTEGSRIKYLSVALT